MEERRLPELIVLNGAREALKASQKLRARVFEAKQPEFRSAGFLDGKNIMENHKRKGFFVTGTGTEIGKTLASLGLCLRFKADYWKPVQTGQPSDTDFISRFLPKNRIYKSSYSLKAPLSPNQAGEKEGIKIDLKKIVIPQSPFLIVEGIGGVYVPLNSKETVMDLIKLIGLPLIVVAKSGLGTLNHSLLTLEALRGRRLKIAGVILSGPKNKKNKRDIEKWGKAPVLMEMPLIPKITARALENLYKNLRLKAAGV